jgi:hypothetical protein
MPNTSETTRTPVLAVQDVQANKALTRLKRKPSRRKTNQDTQSAKKKARQSGCVPDVLWCLGFGGGRSGR